MPEPEDLPDGWRATTLGELGRYLNGRAFKTSEWAKTGRPIIRIQDLTGSNRNPNYYEGEADERHTIRKGDLLVSWSATLGAYIWDGPEAVLNQHIFKVESNIDRRFHYHLVRRAIAELLRNAHGSGMVHVTKGTFDGMPVAVPESPSLQAALAKVIDTADEFQTSASSHLVAARLAIERFRQAVLAAACSGRLTADWRLSHPPLHTAQELIEESRPRATAKARDTDEWTSPTWLDIPSSWLWSPVRELANVRGGIQKQPKRAPKGNAYPYLRVANVQRGSLNLSEVHEFELFKDELATYRLEAGDLLVVEGNGSPNEIGRAALWHGEISNCVHQNHIIRVRPVGMSSEFLELFWNSPIAAREIASLAVTSAGLYSLSTKKIGDVPIPVPPLEEQHEIAQRVQDLLNVTDALLERMGQAMRSVDQSSEAILAKAFRGELVGSAR